MQPALGAALPGRLSGGAGAERDRRPSGGPPPPHLHREYLRIRRAPFVHRILRRNSPLLRDGGHAAPLVWARRMVAGDVGRRAPRAPADRSKTGLAAHLFAVHPRPAPPWYFAANAATTFVLAFLVPFFFFRSNVRAEASLQRIGQWKLKRVIDADLIGVVRGRFSGRIEDANDTFLSLLGYSRQDLAAGALDLGMIAPSGSLRRPSLRKGALPRCTSSSAGERTARPSPPWSAIARLDESDDSNDEVVGFMLDSDSAEASRSPAGHAARQPGRAPPARSLQLDRLPRAQDAAHGPAAQPAPPERAAGQGDAPGLAVACAGRPLRVGGRAHGRAHSRAAGCRTGSSRPAHSRRAGDGRGGGGAQRGERIRRQSKPAAEPRSRCAPRSTSPPSSTRCASTR